ncbi:MAG: hypothetical protein ACYTFG_19065, partial [Planctomycetota bacterium]
MTIVNALRFDNRSGAMVTDEESWHLRRRKTRFSANLFPLTPNSRGGAGVELGYGGVGDPRYHGEVVSLVRAALEKSRVSTMEEAGHAVLEAMHSVTRRLVDDRLRFLFGFDAHSLNRGSFTVAGESFEIKNAAILKRARDIVEGKERPGGRDLSPPN